MAEDEMRRVYVASKRGKLLRCEFTMYMSRRAMAELGRTLLHLASDKTDGVVELAQYEGDIRASH